LKNPLNSDEALKQLAILGSREELCLQDALKKLNRWKISADKHQAILNQLVEEKFIDEKRYTASFVRDKWNLDHWGRLKIRHALKSKKINESLIHTALGLIDEEEYKQYLKDLLLKKYKTLLNPNKLAIKAALSRFAVNRGFEWQLVIDLLNEFPGLEL